MGHELIALKTLNRLKGPPIAVEGVKYHVWVAPVESGWKFRFGISGQGYDREECDLQAVEYIFGHETIEKHFNFARSLNKDEEDIT